MILGACHSAKHGKKRPSRSTRKAIAYQRNYLEKAADDVKKEIPEATVRLVQDSIYILFPEHIVYQRREAVPGPKYKQPLVLLVGLLNRYQETDLLVTGHCDETGSANFNRKLSLKRANFIRDFLVKTGLAPFRIETWGMGNNNPIADNKTEEDRRLNRRVEFVVLYAEHGAELTNELKK